MLPLIELIFDLLYYVLLIRIVLSWFPHNRSHFIIQIIYEISEPILSPFRGMIYVSGFDFSPILAFLSLQIARGLVFRFLLG